MISHKREHAFDTYLLMITIKRQWSKVGDHEATLKVKMIQGIVCTHYLHCIKMVYYYKT